MGDAPTHTGHYENFPVGSLALPEHIRRPVHDIYRFARTADDLADEGDAPAEARLRALDGMRTGLHRIAAGEPPDEPLFEALGRTIALHDLPIQPFHDLLDAFSQDVVKTRYESFPELLDYCRRSADPVGRLLLHLYRAATPANVARSDRICTALQLINFLQDVAIDRDKGRIYLPREDLRRFGVDEEALGAAPDSPAWRSLMDFQIRRAREMLMAGAPLARALEGRIGLELRLIVMGGARILEKLESVQGDVFRARPVLRLPDWLLLGGRALFRYPA